MIDQDFQGQYEALDRENHRMRMAIAKLMARLTVWLDDDQFNEADGILHPEFEPPPSSAEVVAALDRMDALLDPSRQLLKVGFESATAIGCRADMALIRASLSPASVGAEGWTDLPALPEAQSPVLLDIGRKFPIRAMWVAAKTLPAGCDDDDFGEYDEADDEWYCAAGWYEWNEHEERHWSVSAKPLRWMRMPTPGTAASTPSPAIYEAINHLLAHIGAEGSIDARHPLVGGCMEALLAIDGGVYLAKLGAAAAVGAGGEASKDAVDAARYRWLRDVADPDMDHPYVTVHKANAWGRFINTYESGKHLDELVDAARAAQQGAEK